MRSTAILILLMSLLVVVLACGGGQPPPPAPADQQSVQPDDPSEEYADESDEIDTDEDAEDGDEPQDALEETAPSASYLSDLKLTDSPRITEPVKTELKSQELPFGWEIEYQWWVNDVQAEEQTTDTLPPGLFRPQDWIFCMVQLLDDQGNIMQTLRSNRVNVIPLPPRPMLEPIPQFSVPGEFRYQIKAVDPNEPEDNPGETLTYELREPQTENIIINPQSGMLTWNIDTETAKRLEKGMEISFRIISSWGTSITSSINIKISPPENQRQ